jgi:hypothetical protein
MFPSLQQVVAALTADSNAPRHHASRESESAKAENVLRLRLKRCAERARNDECECGLWWPWPLQERTRRVFAASRFASAMPKCFSTAVLRQC